MVLIDKRSSTTSGRFPNDVYPYLETLYPSIKILKNSTFLQNLSVEELQSILEKTNNNNAGFLKTPTPPPLLYED